MLRLTTKVEIMTKKFKATELFLSLGLVASLATACGGPTEGGEAVEGDGETMEQPAEEGAVEEPVEGEMEETEEGGEGGEGGEG